MTVHEPLDSGLKTLKEMTWQGTISDEEAEGFPDCDKGVSLETKRTLMKQYLDEAFTSKKLLKAEAIKWVNNWKAIDNEAHANEIYAFMVFFNITDSDLKEAKA